MIQPLDQFLGWCYSCKELCPLIFLKVFSKSISLISLHSTVDYTSVDSDGFVGRHLDFWSDEMDDDYDILVASLFHSKPTQEQPIHTRGQINQDCGAANIQLKKSYFGDSSEYCKECERQSCMSRDLFKQISLELQNHKIYWFQRQFSGLLTPL